MHDHPDRDASLPVPDVLTVYGTAWCGDCWMARRYLDGVGATYRYVDLTTDDQAQRMLDAAGIRAVPVVVTTDGSVLIEPSERQLAAVVGDAA